MKINSYNEIITLIQPIVTASGETETERNVYACTSSVGYSEYYRATSVGYAPEIKFTLADVDEYRNEPIVKYENQRYNIIRIYRIGTRQIELTCERVKL